MHYSPKLKSVWQDIREETFYDPAKIALVPMGFCYPGKGNSGDLPPRKECAPLWHERLLGHMKHVHFILLVGQYAQRYYLGNRTKSNLTETVRNYREYLPQYLPLPPLRSTLQALVGCTRVLETSRKAGE